MNLPYTDAISFRQIKNSSNAILKLIRQIYFPPIFPLYGIPENHLVLLSNHNIKHVMLNL